MEEEEKEEEDGDEEDEEDWENEEEEEIISGRCSGSQPQLRAQTGVARWPQSFFFQAYRAFRNLWELLIGQAGAMYRGKEFYSDTLWYHKHVIGVFSNSFYGLKNNRLWSPWGGNRNWNHNALKKEKKWLFASALTIRTH